LQVEQMRKAILEGLVPEFASTPFTNQMIQQQQQAAAFGRSAAAAGQMMAVNQRAAVHNGMGGGGMMARSGGGQLVVAGSVVGQWGGNYGVATPAGGRARGAAGQGSGGYRRNIRN
jgi:hypothetical protein